MRTEPSLYVEVFTDADDFAGQLSQLDGLLTNINESTKALKRALVTVHPTKLAENLDQHAHGSPLASPGARHESVATIQPSVHEQVRERTQLAPLRVILRL